VDYNYGTMMLCRSDEALLGCQSIRTVNDGFHTSFCVCGFLRSGKRERDMLPAIF
jgi:hypothetical protein